MYKYRLYFPNLNALRFFAAFFVILHHFEIERNVNPNTLYGHFILGVGKLGVMLFFTLSGFLITYLLLKEKEKTQSINIKSFYIRRILRIWPLYYLIILGALFVFNSVPFLRIPGISNEAISHSFSQKVMLYGLILPNVAYAFNFTLPYAIQAWSIGVEEQFYLIWPILFKKSPKYLRILLLVIILTLLIRLLFLNLKSITYHDEISYFFNLLCFDVMAIGGIAAVIHYKQSPLLEILFNQVFQIFTIALLILFILFNLNFGFLNYDVYAILFSILILNAATNNNFIFNLENKYLDYLGKISYGLYMYHYLAIRLANLIVNKFTYLNSYWICLMLVLTLVIGISTISYELFEKYFIKKKINFSAIISGTKFN